MNLIYRGVPYTLSTSITDSSFDHSSSNDKSISSITIGKYRGVVFQIQPCQLSSKPQASVHLQYRGAPYYPAPRRSTYPTSELA